MTRTHIRTTCAGCGALLEAPATRLLVEMPSSNGPAASPQLALGCPACSAASTTEISWRTAAYLLEGGATCLVAPDEEAARATRPERLRAVSTPLTLDDLIDLHAELNSDIATS
jgi:hypothetical protein